MLSVAFDGFTHSDIPQGGRIEIPMKFKASEIEAYNLIQEDKFVQQRFHG
jgi:hypothetical protein